MSSIYHISAATAPTLIMHGSDDPIVPLYQAERYQEVATEHGVTMKLIVKEGGEHNWPGRADDEAIFVDWFNQQLNP